ncbi:Spo0B domain-containing protein [Caloramator proteoclasticus]|uniref:Sensor_kinase_SpoOB-type, alpha-helical domain n=1 Tax=Caloramator proteoclasticus DSM 10124 TaxID=1121262 RepID=A0A1M4TJ26_9CLOT|nr:Spo0B domain-containing protein [Caloramator proteoclasticus]SHE44415.1 Sensor_kinase_SpoOB-type, alpha-helical domain [Caloramator proteoclasticus DSM 10124]
MKDKSNIKWCMNQMRKQRHDFMNYLQVIYGYLQINKPEEALNYIKKINSRMYMLSQLYNLDNSYLSLIINDIINSIERCALEWQLKNLNFYISEEKLSKNINKYIENLNTFKQELYDILRKEFKKQEIYIDAKEIEEGVQILLYNDMEIDLNNNNLNFILISENISLYKENDKKIVMINIQ